MTASVARDGAEADALDLCEDLTSLVVHRRSTPAASSTSRTRSRSSEHEHRRRGPAPPDADRDRRRPAPLLEPDVHARGNRVQAALLRLGARLPLVAAAPAAALRRALRRLHRNVVRFDDVAHYPAYLLSSIMLWTSSPRPTSGCVHVPGGPREPAAQDPLPAHDDPAVGGADRALQPRHEPHSAADLLPPRRHQPTWTWLLAPVLVGALFVFALGIGIGVSVLFVRYRDMRPIWDVVLQMGFYGSPVIYAITTPPSRRRSGCC